MKIGDSLNIKLPESELVARCKVVDLNEHYLFVDHPIDINTEKSVTIPLGKELIITFIKRNTLYEFSSKPESYVQLRVPAISIPLPDKEQMKRIQRREFVRVKTNLDIAVHCPEKSFTPFTTMTRDISGGGASIILPANRSVQPKQQLNVYFVLRFLDKPFEYIKTKAEVVYRYDVEKVRMFSVKFLLEDFQVQEKIINYCFEVEREKRKQERLL